MITEQELQELITDLSGNDLAFKVDALDAIFYNDPDIRLIPYLEALLADMSPCLFEGRPPGPPRYSELRWKAANALLYVFSHHEIEQSIIIEDTSTLLSPREIDILIDKYEIDLSSLKVRRDHRLTYLNYYTELKRLNLLPTYDIRLVSPEGARFYVPHPVPGGQEMFSDKYLNEVLDNLQKPDNGHLTYRVDELQNLLDLWLTDPRLIPQLERLLEDKMLCRDVEFQRIGELSWLAARVLSKYYRAVQIETPVILHGATLPVSDTELLDIAREANLPDTVWSALDDLKLFSYLRDKGYLPASDVEFTSTLYSRIRLMS